MKFKNFTKIERATKKGTRESARLGIGLFFIVGIMIYTAFTNDSGGTQSTLLVVAAMIGGYMAMNIGANDVANNVGPAVGSRAITMGGAILIAAVFEVMGALIAGGDVVATIRSGIIEQSAIPDSNHFVLLMISALLAGALWLNFATAIGAPVSTTHSIVGAVLGAGIAAGGVSAANWGTMSGIAASWVVSPVLGGMVAAGFLFWIKRAITYQPDMVIAARRTVPILVGIMVFSFTTYLILKGLSRIWKIDFLTASMWGALLGLVVWYFMGSVMQRRTHLYSNTKESINSMFTAPLIFAAVLLSFAHGANDVANAIGPLAAIADTISKGGVSDTAGIPLWVMMVGALGIAVGLALYGPKLIRTVGGEITELDQMRAFCIAMSAAITVIVASQLGLPVSSTHIALGGIFGVGFLREFIKTNYSQMVDEIKQHHLGADRTVVEAFLDQFAKANIKQKREMLDQLKARTAQAELSKTERKRMRKFYKHELVKRTAVFKIVAAWIITVPVSALMAAMLYYMIFGMMYS